MVVLQQVFFVRREVIRQALPCICGGLLTVSFGMMLGWPSIAYPYLVDWEVSPIPITYDQTSLVAGFLMEGNSIGTLFCTTKLISSKTAVFLSACMQLIGFTVLIGANDIFGLLVARSFVGFGNGFGVPQLKRYIKETCEPHVGDVITNYLPLGVNIGVIIAYTVGIFASYRVMAACFVVVPAVCLISFGVIPKKIHPLHKKKIAAQSGIIRHHVNSYNLPANLESSLEENITSKEVIRAKQLTLCDALKRRDVWHSFFLLMLVIFVQQYTGGPANIVYSQMIFYNTGVELPKICSLIYAIFFFIFTAFALTYARNFYRKQNLLISCFMTIVATSTMALYYHLKDDLIEMSSLFTWAPLFVLIFYNAFHTFGLGTTPLLFIADVAPENGRNYPNKLQVIHFSMSAVISTKIFQVLFTYYDYTIAYTFLASVGLFGFITVLLFVRETKPVKKVEAMEVNGNSIICKIEDVEKAEVTKL